jgi:hypothetical protein
MNGRSLQEYLGDKDYINNIDHIQNIDNIELAYNDRLRIIFKQISETKIQSMAKFYFKTKCSHPLEDLVKGLAVAKTRNGDERDLHNLLEIYKLSYLIENRDDYNKRLEAIFKQIPEAKIQTMARFYLKKKCSNSLEELLNALFEGLWLAKVKNGDDRDLRKLLKIYKFSHLNPSNPLVNPSQPLVDLIPQNHSSFFSSSHNKFNYNDRKNTLKPLSNHHAEEKEMAEDALTEDCKCRLF